MRHVKLAAFLAVLMLVVAACGNNGEDAPDEEDNGEVTAPAEESEDERGAELDDDVAAVVDGEEVPTERLEDQVEMFAANPQIAQALEGEDGALTMEVLQAQVLTELIVNVVALAAAEELGVPVTDEDIEDARAELEDDTGGAEGLADAIEEQGISEEQLDHQLRALAAMRNIQEALAAEDDEGADDDEGEGEDGEEDPAAEDPAEPDPAQMRAQQYISERLIAADIVVNDDYGHWDREQVQVVPPGGLPDPAPAPPAPDPDAQPDDS